MTDVLEEEERYTRWYNGGRDWSDASTSQGTLRTASKHQTFKEAVGIIFYRFQGECGPDHNLILTYWSSELWDNNFLCCFKSWVCGSLLWQPWKINSGNKGVLPIRDLAIVRRALWWVLEKIISYPSFWRDLVWHDNKNDPVSTGSLNNQAVGVWGSRAG